MTIVQDRFANLGRAARLRLAAGLSCFLLSLAAFAQQSQTPTLPTLPSALPSAPLPAPARTAAAAEDERNNAAKTNAAAPATAQSANGVLTASQIIAIVQARPELIVDIKQVMADYLEQQGNPVQVDSITDDALYKGIASDAGLRGAISIWLRARGYITDSDFDRSDMDPKSSDDLTNNVADVALQGLPSSLPGSGSSVDSALLDPNRTQNGLSGADGNQVRRTATRQPGKRIDSNDQARSKQPKCGRGRASNCSVQSAISS